MKKTHLFSLLIPFVFATLSSDATHLMAGQITAVQLSGTTYQITTTVYRDAGPSTAALGLTAHLYLESVGTAAWSSEVDMPGGFVVFLPFVEEYTYIDTVTFPASGLYRIYFYNCCRNSSIVNGVNDADFYLQTEVSVDPVSGNSTPVFFNQPVTTAGIHSLWHYTPVTYDADGDSLAWRVDTPQSVSYALPGYVPPVSDTAQPFYVNGMTGEIFWMPSMLGHYVVSLLIDEYRGGIKIGQIRRDMQIIVELSVGSRPAFQTSGWPVNGQGNFQFSLTANSLFQLHVEASDPDSNYMKMYSINGAANYPGSTPHLVAAVNGYGHASATISWTPSTSQLRTAPYLFYLQCNEHTSTGIQKEYLPIWFEVTTLTATTQPEDFIAGSMYPGIVSHEITIPLNLNKSSRIRILLINELGQQAAAPTFFELDAGDHLLLLNNLSLPDGFYFLVVENGTQSRAQKFVVRN